MDKTSDIPEWMNDDPFPFRNQDEDMEWIPETTNGDAGTKR